ncbi:MAG: hypothetical protein KAT70_09620, partial [Thermoplasmata archaeon]|nr:hypothetical protein [Thermoplasmata archaeon]
MKRAMVVGLVMLLVVGGLGMFAFPAAAAEAPLNLRVANRTDSSFTLSWTTENDTTGYVMILGSNYYDVRDPAGGPASYTGTTHYVEVDGLSETTAYTITVYSDGVAYSGGDLPFSSVTTLAVAPTPPPSYQVFGTIYEAEAPPGPEAVNTIVYLESPASAFEPLSFFTQSGGDYMFNLGNIRNSDGSFHYTGAALNTRIVAEGGNKGNAANTQTLGIAGSPEEIVDISLVVVDLYVDTFAPADAEMGIPCTITAWVRNSRPYATTVNVTFYEEDGVSSPDYVVIGWDEVTAVSSSSSKQASLTHTFTQVDSSHNIKVVVRPLDMVEEDNSDNTGYHILPVRGPDAPDLSVMDDDISFSPSSPDVGDLVDITVSVYNVGTLDGTCKVTASAGAWTKTVTSVNIPDGSYRDVVLQNWPIPSGESTVFVELTDASPSENNLENNFANATISPREPDLSIEAVDISFSLEPVREEEEFTVTVTVRNDGVVSGKCNVEIRFGSQSGTIKDDMGSTGFISPGSYKTMTSAPINSTTSGSIKVYAVLSDFDRSDSNPDNDYDYKIQVVTAVDPDLEMISVWGPNPVQDDDPNIKFIANFTNVGEMSIGVAEITFWNGHPDFGGTQIGGSKQSFFLDTGVTKSVTSDAWNATGLEGEYNIVARGEVIDPAGEETDFDNNMGVMVLTVIRAEPDLEVKVFVQDEVYEDDPDIDIYANVTNLGEQTVVSGNLTFWDGDPDDGGVQIDDVIVFSNLEYGMSINLSATWNVSGLAGTHDIYATVVSIFPSLEPDLTNNKAYDTIEVLASDPDMEITTITGPSIVPEDDDNITFDATFANIGLVNADLVTITFWDGDPDDGGVQIGNSTNEFNLIAGGASKTVTSDAWDATDKAGTHKIYAKVEVVNPPGEESIFDNNKDYMNVTVLSVEADIEATNVIAPDEVYEDDDGIVFAALITNVGQQTIVSGSGTFWDGDPDGAGIQIGAAVPFSNLDPSLDRTLYATISWNANGLIGTHQIYFKVVVTDPVGEPDTTNNKVYSVVKVLVSEPDAEATMITGPAEVFEDDSDITFTTTVTNVGQKTVDLASITFWDGHPSTGTQIGSIKYVAGLGTGVSKVATSDVWDATGLAGTHNIFAEVEVVNPAGEETNFDNNIAVMSVKVISAEPDMEVTMVIAPDEVYEDDDNIDLAALIMNVGQQTVVSGSVTFWDGDPDIAGVQIGGAVPFSNLDYEESTTINATVSWDATGLVGTHQIYVQIIVTDPVGEPVTTNNKDYATVKVLASEPDVKVTPITGPSPVQEDDDNIRFNATVINIGRKDAAVVNITFWNGHPDFGGIQIGATKQIFNLLAGGVSKEVTSDAWDATGLEGDYNIRAIAEVVDPAGEETEVSNNMADMFVTVLAVEPDLEVTEVIAPVEVYEDDDNILISADVTNIGLETVVLGEVSFWDGNPDTTGVQIGAAVQFSDLVSGESRIFDATENYNANGKVGTHQIYVRVVSIDPAVEPVMTNNKAHAPMEVLSSEPDLEVTNVDGPAEVFEDDDDIVFTATVTNIDRRTVVEANITFWVGHPDTGTQIGVTKKVYNLALGESVNVLSDAWNAFGLRNTHEIWVDIEVLDPVENETGNNRLALSPYVLVKERPPYVVQSTPADAQINIDVTTSMNITFSKFMNTPDTEGAFTMIREGVTPVSGTFTWYAG